jgi:hypothetical protein
MHTAAPVKVYDEVECGKCKAKHVRLYRPYGNFYRPHDNRCFGCVEPKDFGWTVPLVLAEDGSPWGYTSAIQVDINTWLTFPEHVNGKRVIGGTRAAEFSSMLNRLPMNKVEWGDEDIKASMQYGWYIGFDDTTSDRPRLRAYANPSTICEVDRVALLKDFEANDGAAIEYVKNEADKGDRLCRKAIMYLLQQESLDCFRHNLKQTWHTLDTP